MTEDEVYRVELNKSPDGSTYAFSVNAPDFETASLRAYAELSEAGFVKENAWNGKIYNSKGTSFEILRNGTWLISAETGERIKGREIRLETICL